MERNYFKTENAAPAVRLAEIPVLDYQSFCSFIDVLFTEEQHHCLLYYALPLKDKYRFICCVAADTDHSILIFSHEQDCKPGLELESLTQKHYCFHIFEREIHENFNILFRGHPWLKPVRYSSDRSDREKVMNNYPFYTITSDELHEVGVGPVHAGIIEPGHFRFICHGEKVLHLEIQLGYQHRGVEKLFSEKKSILQRAVLSESIAGDTTLGHALCHAELMESYGNIKVGPVLAFERVIAMELARIAMHIGDTSALCTDIAYQFGQVVNEALRTIIINTLQLWCGNRFGKGLIRAGGSRYPLTAEIVRSIRNNISEVEERYRQVTDRMFSLPSVLGRYEGIGKLSLQQAKLIGAVGMAARSSGLKRDIRWSHPSEAYKGMHYSPVIINNGDVWARAMLRKLEIESSVAIIRKLTDFENNPEVVPSPLMEISLPASSLAISVTEGWRGEICHAAVTDEKGDIIHYKIKDPSFHNWMALALAVRNQEISDFPLCNKSFNLSYCGNDL